MSTKLHVDDAAYRPEINVEAKKVAIIVAEWNSDITFTMADAAYNKLTTLGFNPDNVVTFNVPGSFELTFGAAAAVKSGEFDAVIVFGCVVRGDTPHFDYICQGVTQGITRLNAKGKVPVIFGVLTTDTYAQAQARIDGNVGRKGEECAVDAIKMMAFACEI
jgi:6,7-dimethyl-8-ribityllumazine synthase